MDKKGIIKTMVLSVLLTLLIVGVLGWQYRRMEKGSPPAIEQRIELANAQRVVEKFMNFRIIADESAAMQYLTEQAVLQKNQSEFDLLGNFNNYEILNTEQVGQGQFRFAVKISNQDVAGDFVEIVSLIKVMDQYYVDSIQLAG